MSPVLILFAMSEQPKLTIAEVEKRLVKNGYVDSLLETDWAIKQGGPIVPILEKMLAKTKQYQAAGEFAAFPFNAQYVLAHIDKPEALAALKKYKVVYGIQGWQLRHKMKSQNYGVVHQQIGLHPRADARIANVLLLKPGTEVKILERMVENAREEGPRGGPAYYDHVEVLGGEKRLGYVQRAGDQFDPFF